MHKALYRDNLTLTQAVERIAALGHEHPASVDDVALMNGFLTTCSDRRGIVR
jgi:UDP-N-acetylglucosamine acyltransferase